MDRFKTTFFTKTSILLLSSCLLIPNAFAAFEPSSIDLENGTSNGIPQIDASGEDATSEVGSYQKQSRTGVLLPGEVDVRELLPSSGQDNPPPYGANLFAGGYETERVDGLNDNYLIASGDKINIWIWGAVTYSNVATVDRQGNIFIPNIGPINVLDVPASNINNLVQSKIKQTYTNNVEVYVNLLTATPVSVYLSGAIIRPGQYAGMASDSVLYYLKRAGGIDSDRGSYRSIQIIRNNKVLQEVDLYTFIQTGRLPSITFKDKDVILVKPQKSAVNVAGGVKNPFRFELKNIQTKGSELAQFALRICQNKPCGCVMATARQALSLST